MTPDNTGWVPFRQYRTWYQVTGALGTGRPAVVAVHGGPGSTHDYLRSLCSLAASGWPVVHYDQLGNGGSTHLPDADPRFWTVELFLDELDNLLRRLEIANNYVLFGHSWGGRAIGAARRLAGRKVCAGSWSPTRRRLTRCGGRRWRCCAPTCHLGWT